MAGVPEDGQQPMSSDDEGDGDGEEAAADGSEPRQVPDDAVQSSGRHSGV